MYTTRPVYLDFTLCIGEVYNILLPHSKETATPWDIPELMNYPTLSIS